MKKFMCAALCAVLTLGAVGCGGDKTPATEVGDDVYVTIVESGVGSEWLDAVAAAYYEETGITVHVTPDDMIVSSIINTMNNSGSDKEDLYFLGQDVDRFVKWVNAGSIEPIDDVLDSDKYGTTARGRVVDDSVIEMGKFDGRSYLTSYLYSEWGFVYNQNYLNQIDSYGEYEKGKWPETVKGLIDLCTATKNAGLVSKRTQNVVAPFSCGFAVNYTDWLFNAFWYELDSAGYESYYKYSDTSEYPSSLLDTPAVLSALETVYDVIGATSETESNAVSSSQDHTTSQTSFVNGDCVFTFTGSWFATEMRKVLSQVGLTDYRFGAYPVVKKGDKRVAMMNLPGETFFIPSEANNVVGAKDFLTFALSEKGVAAAERVLNYPMVFSTDEKVEYNEFGKEIVAAAENASLVVRGSNTDVYRTTALNLFGDVNPVFTKMAEAKFKKEEIRDKVILYEITRLSGVWKDQMKKL